MNRGDDDQIDFPVARDWRKSYADQGLTEDVPTEPNDSGPQFYPLRAPCKKCGGQYGHIEHKNGQACVYCDGCNSHQYNAPKKEQGLAPSSTRTDGISPSLRYRIEERAGFRCEFCGASALANKDKVMHVGHMVSERDLRDSGLPPEAYRDEANLVWLCDQCNLGMGKQSISIHDALVFAWRRKLAEGTGL